MPAEIIGSTIIIPILERIKNDVKTYSEI